MASNARGTHCLTASAPLLFIKMASAAFESAHKSAHGERGIQEILVGYPITLCEASANIIWIESCCCIKPVTEHLLLARLLQ